MCHLILKKNRRTLFPIITIAKTGYEGIIS